MKPERRVWGYGKKVVIVVEDPPYHAGHKKWSVGALGTITGTMGYHWLVRIAGMELLFSNDELLDTTLCEYCGEKIDLLESGEWVHDSGLDYHAAIPTFPERESNEQSA